MTPPTPSSRATLDYLGELYELTDDNTIVVGREGDLIVDDNPFLHRRFLQLSVNGGLVWLSNIGSKLSATIADSDSQMQAWLAPGAQVPLVFPRTVVWFTAGPTVYEFDVLLAAPPFSPVPSSELSSGATTVGQVALTPDQHLLLLVLSESMLRRGDRSASVLPSSSEAARRLGWSLTKFNRKLDNVCDKFTRMGIRGLHVGSGRLAVNRRARLVEYALAASVVTSDDLTILDAAVTDVQQGAT